MVRRQKIKVTEEERMIMLFWYTVFNGNYSQTAKRVSDEMGYQRSRKVVMDTAKRWNFATLAHVVRDEVNKRFYGSDTPGMGRITKMTADLLEIDEDLLIHCKRYLRGDSKAKIENISELLRVVNHVAKEVTNITGVSDVKKNAFAQISETMRESVGIGVDDVLQGLNEKGREEVVGRIVEQQITTILENKGKLSDAQKKKQDDLAKDLVENMDKVVSNTTLSPVIKSKTKKKYKIKR